MSKRRVGLLVQIVGVVVLSVACGNSDRTVAEPEDGADRAVVQRGGEVFQESCAACHGAQGQGNFGPPLSASSDRIPDDDEVLDVVLAGRGQMPSFEAKLSRDDIEAVVRFVQIELSVLDDSAVPVTSE